MRRTLKSAIALLAVSALPLIAVAPAAAYSPSTSAVTFDCSDEIWNFMEETEGPFDQWGYVGLYDNPTTVTLLNCETKTIGDFDDTENAVMDGTTIDDSGISPDDNNVSIVISGPVSLDFFDDPDQVWNEGYWSAHIEASDPFDMADPSGVQLVEETAEDFEIGNLQDFTIGADDDIFNHNDILIDDNETCAVIAGTHMYKAQSVKVNVAGEFTFRGLGLEPNGDYLLNEGTLSPLQDPMFAIYSDFDPQNPGSNVVSCNDDLNDLVVGDIDYTTGTYSEDSLGNRIEGHMPYFVVDLEPGTYTLVLTTYAAVSADEFASGTSNSMMFPDWDPENQTVFYDVWGPEGGLELTDGSLASTGVDPSFGLWSGLALAGTGVAITVARRRAQRA